MAWKRRERKEEEGGGSKCHHQSSAPLLKGRVVEVLGIEEAVGLRNWRKEERNEEEDGGGSFSHQSVSQSSASHQTAISQPVIK